MPRLYINQAASRGGLLIPAVPKGRPGEVRTLSLVKIFVKHRFLTPKKSQPDSLLSMELERQIDLADQFVAVEPQLPNILKPHAPPNWLRNCIQGRGDFTVIQWYTGPPLHSTRKWRGRHTLYHPLPICPFMSTSSSPCPVHVPEVCS